MIKTPAWDGRSVTDLLDLTPLAGGRFRSRCNEANENKRVYGGQMLGQALAAAARTTSAERPAAYMQFLFAAGGFTEQTIDYEVIQLQEGKRFSSRSVRGSQANGRLICDAGVTFAAPIEAPARQSAPSSDSGLSRDPETLPRFDEIDGPETRDVEAVLAYTFRAHPAIDLRAPFVEDLLRSDPLSPRMRFYIRLRHHLTEDQHLHAAAFAYLSDYWLNFVACLPHVPAAATAGKRLYIASLNHTIWMHRPLRADEWLLFDCHNPSSGLGRALSVARVYNRAADLVASATQECLIAPAD